MRKLCIYILLVLGLASSISRAENISGKSYLSSQTFNLVCMDMTFANLMDQHFENGSVLNKPQIQISAFGGRTNNSDKLRRYFLFDNKSVLVMNEAPASDTTSIQDIVGLNFNIYSNNSDQSSAITFSPVQTFGGAGLSGRFAFREKWWFIFEAPYVHIHNNLNIEEVILNDGGGLNPLLGINAEPSTVVSMIEAFDQPGMHYGKINGKQTKTGFSDILLLVGYDFTDQRKSYFSPFTGVVLPTSNKPTAEYLWEPILGNNKHFGFILGIYGHTMFFKKGNNTIWFSYFTESQYLLSNTQKRSFDLKRGPWTRYLALYGNEADRKSTIQTLGSQGIKRFGINYLTQDVHVSPGVSNFGVTAFSLLNRNMNFTLGLTSFIKTSESVELINNWIVGPEVADLVNNNESNLERNISTLSSSASINANTQIQVDDIDFSSATCTNVFVGSIYATLGYYQNDNHPKLYEVGASYESSKQNNALDRYTIWGKFQITF